LVFFRSVPTPEVTFAGDTCLKEIGEGLKNFGIGETGRSDVGVFVEAISRLGPGEVADARAAVTIFGVAGIEPHVESEGFALGLRLQEIDAAINDEVGFVAQGAVRHFFEEGIATDGLELVEVSLLVVGPLGAEVPFSVVAGAVVILAEKVGIENRYGFGSGPISLAGVTIAACGETGENGGPTGPADGVADESLLETGAAFGESVDIGRFNDGVSVAAESANRLVVSEEEDDVWLFSREGRNSRKAEGERCEKESVHVIGEDAIGCRYFRRR